MKLKLTWLMTLFMAFVIQFSFAQEKAVSGTVTSVVDGLPLPGVSIIVKGTTRGVQSDFDGKYTINVSAGETLAFSFVSMKSTEVVVGANNTINVALEEDIAALDEVIIVGYGTTTRQAYAGTAKTVEAKDIEFKNYSNVSQSLAGEAAGVNVINTSGQPGTSATIRIRGFGSVNGNRAPLYVVDGVPYSGSLNAVNPSDIQSTTILKDATATAIYGSRGANGVILITTKSGSARETYVEVDVKTGVSSQIIPRYQVVTSPEESIGLIWEAKVNRERLMGNPDPIGTVNNTLFTNAIVAPGYNMWNVANGAELIDPATGQVRPGVTRRYTPERFEDLAFNPAFRTEANLRMGGGTDKSKYFFSTGYLDDNGYSIKTGYKRYSTRLNLNTDIKEWLNVGANIAYTYSESINNGQTDGAENIFEFADKMNPIYPVYLRDNNYQLVPDPIFGGYQYDYGTNSGFRPRPNANNLNPIASALYDHNGTDRHEINASFTGKIKLTSDLSFETTFGAQYSNNIFKSMGNQFYGVATANDGDIFMRQTETRTINFLQLLRYKKSFGNHTLEVLAAHESNEFKQSLATQFKGKAVIPGGLELDNYIVNLSPATGYSQARTLESYFGQVNYDFDNKYYLTASVRRDGSSRFYKNKWDTFGSVGAAWVMSNEEFLRNSDVLTFLKLKASYGITGDENGVGFYTGINTFDVTNVNGGFSVRPRLFANPELTWETAQQYQAGVEFTLGNFLDVGLDYYIKDTDNLIFDRRNAPSSGVAIITVNDGILRNSGFEFDLTGHFIRKQNVALSLSVNGAMYNNELRTMPIDPQTGEPAQFNVVGSYGYSKGSSIYDFYIREYAGVDPADGYPMWNQYFDDINGDGEFNAGDVAIGSLEPYLNQNSNANIASRTTKTYASSTLKYVNKSAIPDVVGAFRLNAKVHDFNISAQFAYSLGGYGYDAQYAELMHDNNGGIAAQNRHIDVRDRWRQPGDITDVPLIADRVIPNVNSSSTRFITKTDYLALNNLLIGYTLPTKYTERIGVSGLNIYASGDNLFFKGERKGYNPTTTESGNSGRALYAPLTTFTLGVRVKI